LEQLFDMDEDEELIVFNEAMMSQSKKALINYIVMLQRSYIILNKENTQLRCKTIQSPTHTATTGLE